MNVIYVWYFTFCLVSFLKLVYSVPIRSNNNYKLDIIHLNDFHDRYEETSLEYSVCTSNDSQCIGGFSRMYHEINVLLREKPDAIVLNAGDVFQGTYWYTLKKWIVPQIFFNMIPFDAHALGNHEFDSGVSGLAPYLAGLRAPVLAANINTTLEPIMDNLYMPNIVVERNKRRIGIIGLITPRTADTSRPGGVTFLDPVSVTREQARLLRSNGVDIIVLLSHCGLEQDKEIAREAGENVDIIIGGHSHSLLWNGTPPSREPVVDTYPVLVETESKPKHKVLIVQASALTKYLGNLTVYFDSDGEFVDFEGSPIFLNRSIPEDPKIKALLQPYTNELHDLVNTVVGHTTEQLSMNSCASEECALGNMITDAFMEETKRRQLSNLPHVAFVTRTSIRGGIPKGDITRGTVINSLPFSNRVVAFTLKGKYIVEAMKGTMNVFWTKTPFRSPRLPQVSGMKVTLDTINGTVKSILVNYKDDYAPLVPEQYYQVITYDFFTSGGDGFEVLKNTIHNTTLLGVDNELVEKYLKRSGKISPLLENRLIVLS